MTDQIPSESTPSPTAAEPAGEYTVLARKYRPANFDALIGQEAMVRTLTNAIEAGRLAHAFVLTGVRGVGKTTTARIIARVLNCIGADGRGGPTAQPCGVCEHCRAIAGDRHVDVLEMDAASRTGVDDIRELIESVRYRPTSARYKVYIIDEVHMLSKNAFNALLKTLEEPPEHVKFIFATTEIRKIPVTVLSRCQRFDLRRVDMATLGQHFSSIAERENAAISDGALALIARAADGSVRDGLSLLDQVIAQGAGRVDEQQVRDMLGLADRSQIFKLLQATLAGDIGVALELLDRQYRAGADPATVLEDMLEITHWLTRIKVVPKAADDPGVPEIERVQGRDMAGRLAMAAIARAWQMLLKGLAEVRTAPSPIQAAEMVLVRLAYTADLPTPAEALKAIDADAGGSSPWSAPAAAVDTASSPRAEAKSMLLAVAPPIVAIEPDEQDKPDPRSFQQVAELAGRKRASILRANVINNVHLVHFEPGRIEVSLGHHAPHGLPRELADFLNENTARRWTVAVSSEPGQPPLQQQWDGAAAEEKVRAAKLPLVKAVLDTFPGATIEDVRPRRSGSS